MSLLADISGLYASGAFWLLAACLFGYLCGSIPFGLILTRFAGLGDVRSVGSGNTGATNVLRLGNRKIAALTLLCDIAKGALPTAFFSLMLLNLGIVAGFFAFIGHIFPVWLNFKGGKGVATYLGVLLAASLPCAALFIIVWLAVAWYRRYSSLAALTASVAAPVLAFWTLSFFAFLVFACMSGIIFMRHKDNIERLKSGSEPQIKKHTPKPKSK